MSDEYDEFAARILLSEQPTELSLNERLARIDPASLPDGPRLLSKNGWNGWKYETYERTWKNLQFLTRLHGWDKIMYEDVLAKLERSYIVLTKKSTTP